MNINRLGLLVTHLGKSQLSFQLTKEVNSALYDDYKRDICVFVENTVQLTFQNYFPIMSMYYAYAYAESLVATNITTAKKLINFPASNNKFFYVWDLEWSKIKEKNYLELKAIYASPNIKIIARSDMHAKIIENCWDTKVVAVVEDFNIQEMIGLINGTK